MRYLILFHEDKSFEIADSKDVLEEELQDVSEKVITNGMVDVFEYDNMMARPIKVKARPSWTIE